MTNRNDKRPIVIKKVKKAHHGHHGGAWKVAYADFVTAMMAFFMVMWIMGMDPTTKDLIQGYFQNPVGFEKGFGAGSNPLSKGNALSQQTIQAAVMSLRDAQRGRFARTAESIRLRLEADGELRGLEGKVEISITPDGLRIELIDAGRGDLFFAVGSAVPSHVLERALEVIGRELGGLPDPIVLEGHTDARQYGSTAYTNWELSVDRANAARRLLLRGGVGPERIDAVRGLADRQLRLPENPTDPANRRVSIMLPFAPEPTAAPASPVAHADSVLDAVLPLPRPGS